MTTKEARIGEVKKYGLKARGKSELLKYLRGKKISRSEAITAKCYECEGYYTDGKHVCTISSCPLYDYQPYRQGLA